MIKLIIGSRGSGKTKTLVEMVNSAAQTAKGNVVCIEKNMKLTYEVKHTVRLIDLDTYKISGFDSFYGFFAGLMAGNYDITDVFIDGILKVGGKAKDLDGFGELLARIEELIKDSDTNVIFTVSCDADQLPESVSKYPH